MSGFFELTLLDGSKIMISRSWVISVTASPAKLKLYNSPAQSLINLDGEVVAVQESYDVVVKYLVGHV